jgi:hypothetical protein
MAAALTRLEELESALNVCVHVGMVGVIDGGCVIGVERRGGATRDERNNENHTSYTDDMNCHPPVVDN